MSQTARLFKSWVSSSNMMCSLLIATLFINILSLALPITLLQIYDRIIPNQATATLNLLIIGVTIALILELFLRISRASLNAWSDARLEHNLSTRTFNHLLNSELSAYEQQGAGSHLEQITALNHCKGFYGEQALVSLIDIPFVTLFIALIYYLGGIITIIPIAALILAFTIAMLTGRNLYHLMEQRHTIDDQRMNFFIETLSGIHTIKSNAMEAQMVRRYERLQKNSACWDFKLTEMTANTLMFSRILSQITVVAVVGFGSFFVINQQLSIGALAACAILSSRTLQPVNRLMMLWKRLQGIDLAKNRLKHIEQLPVTPQKSSIQRDTAVIEGALELTDINFRHNAQIPLLEAVDVSIPAKSCIALSDSANGCSTLLHLIMGLIQPNNGTIAIDGKPLSDFSHDDLRNIITYLPQRGELFHGTILENITLFTGGDRVEKARGICKKLNIDKTILKLANGYETMVNDTLIETFSPSLKQMITIARALIDEPKVILYDQTDTDLEISHITSLRDALLRFKTTCTIIIVSNQAEINALADTTYHLEDNSSLGNNHDTSSN